MKKWTKEGHKECSKCGEVKPLEEFNQSSASKGGLFPQCRECQKVGSRESYNKYAEKRRAYRNLYRKNNPEKTKDSQKRYRDGECRFERALISSRSSAKKHGYLPCLATVDEVKALYTGFCAICAVPELELTRKLALDHCHLSGVARGFLCQRCNQGIGCFYDDTDLLIDSLHYLMSTAGKKQLE